MTSQPEPAETDAPKVQQALLGEILVERGLIDETQLDNALQHKKEMGIKLGQALVSMGLVSEMDIADALDDQGRITTIQLSPEIVDFEATELLGAKLSWELEAIAVNQIAGVTTVAVEDPEDTDTVDELVKVLGGAVLPVYASPSAIQTCLEHFFPQGGDGTKTLEAIVAGSEEEAI